MKQFVIAHDLGTTGNKATLYNKAGQLVASAFHAYGTVFEHTGWAEQNPNDWWEAVCISTKKMLSESNTNPENVACVTFSGQMMGSVPLDENARPLRDAIIWADIRATDQVAAIAEKIDPAQVYRTSGHRLSSSYTLPKMLWIRDNQPDIYAKTHKFVHAKDAMVARLTGKFVTDPSDASGMNCYDLSTLEYAPAIVDASGINPDKLPDVVPSTEVVGGVLPSVADEVGLPAGTPVVIGGGDGCCAAVGAGVIKEGTAYNYAGSSSWVGISTKEPIFDPDERTFSWAHMVPGMYHPTGTMQTAGASYQWTRDQLCGLEVEAAEALDISPYELMNLNADKSPPGANGLVFLPYLLGERSPRWNTKARGAFVGLSIRHTRADMVRSVLEGVTMNLRVIIDAFTRQGADINAMRVIGGGARGRFWNQMMADIYEMPVHRLSILEEATSMGAALAGGIGVGLYSGWDMIDQMNTVESTVMPNPQAAATYQKMLPIFEASYHALVPVYDMLAELP